VRGRCTDTALLAPAPRPSCPAAPADSRACAPRVSGVTQRAAQRLSMQARRVRDSAPGCQAKKMARTSAMRMRLRQGMRSGYACLRIVAGIWLLFNGSKRRMRGFVRLSRTLNLTHYFGASATRANRPPRSREPACELLLARAKLASGRSSQCSAFRLRAKSASEDSRCRLRSPALSALSSSVRSGGSGTPARWMWSLARVARAFAGAPLTIAAPVPRDGSRDPAGASGPSRVCHSRPNRSRIGRD